MQPKDVGIHLRRQNIPHMQIGPNSYAYYNKAQKGYSVYGNEGILKR